MNKILAMAALGLLLGGGLAATANAAPQIGLYIGTEPPPPRVERVPPPRRGYVWAPGYWRWNGNRHVWARGHWERERRGYHYVDPRWETRGPGNSYEFHRGGWERN